MKNKLFCVVCIIIAFFAGIVAYYIANSAYDKQQAKALFYLAGQYYEQHKYNYAAYFASQSISKNANEYGPLYLLGDIYYRQGDYQLSEQMYKTALNKINNNTIHRKGYLIDRNNIQQKLENITRSDTKK